MNPTTGATVDGCEISASIGAGRRVLTVVGDVDFAASEKLEAAIAGAVEDLEPGSEFVLDLAGVGFLDSMGLRALLLGSRAASAAAVQPVFVLSAAVIGVLQMAGIGPGIFGIAASDWGPAAP